MTEVNKQIEQELHYVVTALTEILDDNADFINAVETIARENFRAYYPDEDLDALDEKSWSCKQLLLGELRKKATQSILRELANNI